MEEMSEWDQMCFDIEQHLHFMEEKLRKLENKLNGQEEQCEGS